MIKKIKHKIEKKVIKKVVKLVKKLAKKAAKKHKLTKTTKHIRHKAKRIVKKMIKKVEHKLVREMGKHKAKKVIRAIKRAAVRHEIVAVHKITVVHHHHESKALQSLKAVGRKVTIMITKEALANHKSHKVAVHQGQNAGAAAIKFAATLIEKNLVKKVGAARAHRMMKRVKSKANTDAKH
jgi:hypothetical protein